MRVFLLLTLLLFAVPAASAEELYICPMHPHIEGGPGDTCPICGMDLVPANPQSDVPPADTGEMPAEESAVHISPAYQQSLGVQIGEVRHQTFGESVRAFGRVEPSTRAQHVYTVREDGWIVELEKSAVGDPVEEGDLLFTYYSPDLMTAQSDYLIGRRGGSIVGDPEQRLRLYGMDEKAISALKTSGKMMQATPFHAPASGTVTRLEAREGMYLPEGGAVMTIQDFSEVWITADVPVRDVPALEAGQGATVTLTETGEEFPAQIDFIHPVAEPSSRTVPVRFVVENPGGTLRPGMAADVAIEAKVQSRLAVPQEAVLLGKDGAYVFKTLGNGRFTPTMVETGITAQGMTEILSGLSHGEQVVTSGQFMIDAESSLRGGMAAMGHDHGDEMPRAETQANVNGGGHVHE